MMPRRFYKPHTCCIEGQTTWTTKIKVGDITIDDSFVDEKVWVRWPNGDEELVTVDYGLFPGGDSIKFDYRPFFVVDLHGLFFNIMLDDMRAIKIPSHIKRD